MTVVRWPEHALYFVGALFVSPEAFDAALPDLCRSFGSVLCCSDPYPWDRSAYYLDEMGGPLQRRFVFFGPPGDTSGLVQAKHATVAIEQRLSVGEKRKINLDPGYVTLAKVVLASRKNYSHRIHIGDRVFAEVELYCEAGGFKPLPYTYFDYREAHCIGIFDSVRQRLKRLLKERDLNPAPEAGLPVPAQGEQPQSL